MGKIIVEVGISQHPWVLTHRRAAPLPLPAWPRGASGRDCAQWLWPAGPGLAGVSRGRRLASVDQGAGVDDHVGPPHCRTRILNYGPPTARALYIAKS